MANYDQLSVNKMRTLLRKNYPETKGAFSAGATREECLTILSGTEMPEIVMEAWAKRMNPTNASTAETPIMPAEGVHGDAVPDLGEPVPDTPEARLLEAQRILRAVGKDVIAQDISDVVNKAAESAGMARSFDRTTATVPSEGGTIRVANVEWPLHAEHDKNHDQHWAVPSIDKTYRFDFWRSSRQCGALTFEQGAEDLLHLLDCDERILIVGPPATGKTSVITQYAARVGWPVTRFNGNRDITMHDFLGTYEAMDGATKWVDGPLPVAMKHGHILILDEVDHMPAECSSVLHSVMEPGGTLNIMGQDEPVKPHSNFRIVGTANTAGFGDESGLHPNAQVQDAAFLSRYSIVFRADYLAPAAERDLLRKLAGIGKTDAELIVKMANDTRRAAAESQLMYPVTLRQTMAMAKMMVKYDWGTALTLTVLNKLPGQDVGAVAEIAQRHLGDKLGGSLVT